MSGAEYVFGTAQARPIGVCVSDIPKADDRVVQAGLLGACRLPHATVELSYALPRERSRVANDYARLKRSVGVAVHPVKFASADQLEVAGAGRRLSHVGCRDAETVDISADVLAASHRLARQSRRGSP